MKLFLFLAFIAVVYSGECPGQRPTDHGGCSFICDRNEGIWKKDAIGCSAGVAGASFTRTQLEELFHGLETATGESAEFCVTVAGNKKCHVIKDCPEERPLLIEYRKIYCNGNTGNWDYEWYSGDDDRFLESEMTEICLWINNKKNCHRVRNCFGIVPPPFAQLKKICNRNTGEWEYGSENESEDKVCVTRNNMEICHTIKDCLGPRLPSSINHRVYCDGSTGQWRLRFTGSGPTR